MALSPGFQRLRAYLGPEIEKMLARQAARLGTYDRVDFDGSIQAASVWRGRNLVWRGKAEVIGVYSPSIGSLRWWWHGRIANVMKKGRLDTVLDQAKQHQIAELSRDHAEVTTEADARVLANLVAQLARAEGVLRIESEEFGVQFLAMFEGSRDRASTRDVDPSPRQAAAQYTMPAPTAEPLATAKSRVQTVHGAQAPVLSVPLPVREPSREVIAPLVRAALDSLARLTQGFSQALMTVVVEMKDNKVRFTVQVVALDAANELLAVDTTRELQEAAAQMIANDVRSGNGRWGKLVVKLRRTERGAAVEVSVHA